MKSYAPLDLFEDDLVELGVQRFTVPDRGL